MKREVYAAKGDVPNERKVALEETCAGLKRKGDHLGLVRLLTEERATEISEVPSPIQIVLD